MWRWLLVVVPACGSSNTPKPDAPDATVSGTASDWMSPTTFGSPIVGATVCVMDTNLCVQTDSAGNYALNGFPANADTGLSIAASGHLRTIFLFHTTTGAQGNAKFGVVTDAVAQQKVQDAVGTYPLAGTGVVEVRAYVGTTPLSGATDTITPASGTGPAYLGTNGYPDRTLTATSAEGGVMFVNVAPGTFDVAIALAGGGQSCTSVTMPVEADTLSSVEVRCD